VLLVTAVEAMLAFRKPFVAAAVGRAARTIIAKATARAAAETATGRRRQQRQQHK